MDKLSETPKLATVINLDDYRVNRLSIEEMADIVESMAELPLEVTEVNEKAACYNVDPNLFYPERGISNKEARRACAACLISKECLRWGVLYPENFGIWGGSSARERRAVRRNLMSRHKKSKQPAAGDLQIIYE